PVQLVLWLPGPSRIPALATINDAIGPVVAVAGDALWLALDAVAAAREVDQRAQNHRPDQGPCEGRSAPPHAVQACRGGRSNWGGGRLLLGYNSVRHGALGGRVVPSPRPVVENPRGGSGRSLSPGRLVKRLQLVRRTPCRILTRGRAGAPCRPAA